MLVLTRKAGEFIIINGNITVQLLSINGNRIRLGIDAPECVKILRNECARRDKGSQKNGQNHPAAASETAGSADGSRPAGPAGH